MPRPKGSKNKKHLSPEEALRRKRISFKKSYDKLIKRRGDDYIPALNRQIYLRTRTERLKKAKMRYEINKHIFGLMKMPIDLMM